MAKHPGGRPTKYNPKFHPKMGKLAAATGKSDEEIAKELEITTSTLYLWKNKYPEFSEAIKVAKEDPNDLVEAALFKRAIGYTLTLKKEIAVSLGAGMGSELQTAKVQTHIPPDTTAQIFFLTHRRPEKWPNKQNVNHSGELTINNLTPEERRARINALKAKDGAN